MVAFAGLDGPTRQNCEQDRMCTESRIFGLYRWPPLVDWMAPTQNRDQDCI